MNKLRTPSDDRGSLGRGAVDLGSVDSIDPKHLNSDNEDDDEFEESKNVTPALSPQVSFSSLENVQANASRSIDPANTNDADSDEEEGDDEFEESKNVVSALPSFGSMRGSPSQLARRYSKHDLLTFASHALEAAATASADALDTAKGEEFVENPLSKKALDEEVEDLTHLDEAFSHLAGRYRHRPSVAVLGEVGSLTSSDQSSSPTSNENGGKSRFKWSPSLRGRSGTIATILSRNVQSGVFVVYEVPKVRHFYEDAQHERRFQDAAMMDVTFTH